ncbi:hypothetical protein FEM18_35730, partial [Pseudomonas aeruginosa]
LFCWGGAGTAGPKHRIFRPSRQLVFCFFWRRDSRWGGGQGGVPALCENSMRPRVASEQKVIGFEPNQRYVAN